MKNKWLFAATVVWAGALVLGVMLFPAAVQEMDPYELVLRRMLGGMWVLMGLLLLQEWGEG